MAFENGDSLESFMREQEKILMDNEKYSRFLFVPIVVIAVSLLVLAYNFTAERFVPPDETPETSVSAAVEEKKDEAQADDSSETEDFEKINLNTATPEELESLHGIGEVKADAIVELREKMGGFRSVEDILNAEGIGEKTLENIRDRIFVE